MVSCWQRSILLSAVVAGLATCIASTVDAQASTAGTQPTAVAGVHFPVPRALIPTAEVQAPAVLAWQDREGTVVLEVLLLPPPGDGFLEEIQEWARVGPEMVESFASDYAKVLEEALGVACTYDGSPLRRDIERLVVELRADFACASEPTATLMRVQLIVVATHADMVVIRLASLPTSTIAPDSVMDEIWRALEVEPGYRVVSPEAVESAVPDGGGPVFQLTDYGQIRPEALFFEMVGTIVGALLWGALFCAGVIRLGGRPMPALIISQLLVLFFYLWGNEHDGVWEFNWLIAIPAAVIGVLALRGWAQRRWDKRHSAAVSQGPDTNPR